MQPSGNESRNVIIAGSRERKLAMRIGSPVSTRPEWMTSTLTTSWEWLSRNAVWCRSPRQRDSSLVFARSGP